MSDYRWKTYASTRAAFAVDYPSFMTAARMPENSDSQRWTFGERASMTVAALSNARNETIQDWYKDAAKISGVREKRQSDNWYTTRGVDPSTHKMFWLKTMRVEDRFLTVTLEYDADLKDAFEPVVGRVAGSLKSTR